MFTVRKLKNMTSEGCNVVRAVTATLAGGGRRGIGQKMLAQQDWHYRLWLVAIKQSMKNLMVVERCLAGTDSKHLLSRIQLGMV